MLDEAGVQTFVQELNRLWIGPEIEKRTREGKLPHDFKLWRCLIRLPKGQSPIVEFNHEIHWEARVKVSDGREFQVGEVTFLDDMEKIEGVKPPMVNGVPVAFVFAWWCGHNFSIIFDFTPNHADFVPEPPDAEWKFSQPIASMLQETLIELAIQLHDTVQGDLQKIGLWAAPALLPYPLARIASLVRQGDEVAARQLLVKYCTPAWISEQAAGWWAVPQFQDRKKLIEQALAAQASGHFCLTIPALMPHLEGIITDWAHTRIPDVKWRQDTKTKQFRDLVLGQPLATFTYKRVVESTMGFILTGPVLSTFKGWYDSFDTCFANRNVVEHGKYDDRLFTEENSIKLFLMLDTIKQIIAGNIVPATAPSS